MSLTQAQFLQQRPATRGSGNAQPMHVPFWAELVRSGETAYAAARRYGCESRTGSPGWCFDRFGMTRTRLPDGRIVCIAGEHEDHYDPDFFIYNDVVVIHPGGAINFYAYAPEVFPPTDFHTATIIGDAIYIIGRLGYAGDRGGASTPIHRLDLRSMRIRPVIAGGHSPGWLHRHRAQLAPDGVSIRVAGGKVLNRDANGKETLERCNSTFRFDTGREIWTPDEGAVPTLGDDVARVAASGCGTPLSCAQADQLRDAITRAVAPDHPLFCGDFWPVAEGARRVAIAMLDGSNRWATCESPSYCGREYVPLAVSFYPTADRLLQPSERDHEET